MRSVGAHDVALDYRGTKVSIAVRRGEDDAGSIACEATCQKYDETDRRPKGVELRLPVFTRATEYGPKPKDPRDNLRRMLALCDALGESPLAMEKGGEQ